MIIFVKRDLQSCFTGITDSSVGAGFMVSVTLFWSYMF